MIKFFDKPSDFVIGCDPGPEHSAFAVIDCRDGLKVAKVEYVPNSSLRTFTYGSDVLGVAGIVDSIRTFMTFAFERCAVQSGGANQLVFETCMAAGEIRHLMERSYGTERCHSFTPSDWRYVLTGKGCANDANVRAVLLTLVPDCDRICRGYSMKAKKMYDLRKPITSHLRDAVGVALATGFVGYRRGLSLSQFPARLEVHCG